MKETEDILGNVDKTNAWLDMCKVHMKLKIVLTRSLTIMSVFRKLEEYTFSAFQLFLSEDEGKWNFIWEILFPFSSDMFKAHLLQGLKGYYVRIARRKIWLFF